MRKGKTFKMNILFLCPDRNDATSWYRSAGIAHDLENKSGHIITVANWNQLDMSWSIIMGFDIILLQRPFTKVAADLCQYIKCCGKSLWVDYDDNLFAVNPENPTFDIYDDPENQNNIKNILKIADAVSVPTEYLRQAYIPYNKNIEVIPNAFNDGVLKRGELKKREKIIAWRGPVAHIYDLMTFGKEINRCVQEFPQWEFNFIGYRPWFLCDSTNKGYLKAMDIMVYFGKLLDMAPGAFHVPLHDNTFNRCRSDTAYMEATFAGAVTVTPEWWNAPYSLPYTDTNSYYEVMRSVLAGEIDIEVENRKAWEYICDCRMLSKINVQRIQLINSIL